jgi:hypothetical protein
LSCTLWNKENPISEYVYKWEFLDAVCTGKSSLGPVIVFIFCRISLFHSFHFAAWENYSSKNLVTEEHTSVLYSRAATMRLSFACSCTAQLSVTFPTDHHQPSERGDDRRWEVLGRDGVSDPAAGAKTGGSQRTRETDHWISRPQWPCQPQPTRSVWQGGPALPRQRAASLETLSIKESFLGMASGLLGFVRLAMHDKSPRSLCHVT